MIVHDSIKMLLEHGVLLQVIFGTKDEKVFYTLTCETSFYKELGFKTNVITKYIDILRDLPFYVEGLTLHGYDCINLPAGIRSEDFKPNSFMQKTFGQKFLKTSNEYKLNITDTIKMRKAEFVERCITFLDRFNLENRANRKDLALLMFYPDQPNFSSADKLLDAIKTNIVDTYHLLGEKGVGIIPALTEIGISTNSILECSNSEIINAVKNQWFNLIQYEKTLEQQRINSIKNNMLLENSYTADHLNQFEEYNFMLMNIKKSTIDKCKTVKEVIAFWPAILQPQPWYVYEY